MINFLYPEGGKPDISKVLRIKGTNKLIYADSRSHIGWSNLVYGCYEDRVIELMRSLVKGRQKRVAIDVGANIGHYSLILSELFEKVYGFEPVGEFRARFQKNIELNKLSNVETLPTALGEKTEAVEMAVLVFHEEPQTASVNTGHYLFQDEFQWKFQKSSVITLDSFVAERNLQSVDYIKIDTDGSEREILSGAMNTLKQFGPIVQIELDEVVEKWLGTPTAVRIAAKILKSLGYQIIDVHGKFYDKEWYRGNFFAMKI